VYRLLGRLEASELSELYRAERVGGGTVVIKLFHPKTSDVAYARVIAGLAQRLAGVAADGLARVQQLGFYEQRLAIVREDLGRYTLGQALQRLNTREVVLPPAVALAFIIELAELIEASHRAGVVHGALTPGNVLLGADGRAAIADFGALAALMASPTLKKAFAARGRSSYRAPELKGSAVAEPASDVYALGAMAYELLTLREPSVGKDSVSTRPEKLPPPSRLVRRLHSRIDPVIMRALEAAPSRRQKSAGELAAGLRDFLAGQGGLPTRDDVKKFVDELFPRDVVSGSMGPVPFNGSFSLEDIDGVSDQVADHELPDAIGERAPFSGGAVDARTPTIDGLPAFTDLPELQTTPETSAPVTFAEVEAVELSWHAPAGVKPAPPAAEAVSGEVHRRVRVVEDFAPQAVPPVTTQGSTRRLAVVGPKIGENSPRQAQKTLMTFAVPFKREGDPQRPDFEKERQVRQRNAQVATRTGASILTVVTMGMVAFWLWKSPDPIADLISWMPGPIEVELSKHYTPRAGGPRGAAPPTLPTVKLPDFEKLHPEKALPKDLGAAPVQNKVPPPATAPTADCYAPPSGQVLSTLTIATARSVRVELDGVRLCGTARKASVAAGTHRVRVIDLKTGKDWKGLVKVQGGRGAKVVPEFP